MQKMVKSMVTLLYIDLQDFANGNPFFGIITIKLFMVMILNVPI